MTLENPLASGHVNACPAEVKSTSLIYRGRGSFASICTFTSIFLIYKWVYSLDFPLHGLQHPYPSLKKLNKISHVCSFSICMRATILPSF